MVDNSWIKRDGGPGSASKSGAIRTKILITVAIILIAAVATVALNGLGSNATQYRSQGIVVDFGEYTTIWSDADFNVGDDPVELLEVVKTDHESDGFDYTMTGGVLTDVSYMEKDYPNDGTRSWGLWYVPMNSFDAVKSDTYDIKASDYNVVIWAYTENDGGVPMPAVDATMTSIYGYAEPKRLVTLSPVCTETVSFVGGVQMIVGADMYSDYPQDIVDGRKSGKVSVVGSYTDPSYEAIMHTKPDLVFCDASTYNDIEMARMLRASDVNSVVLYNGEDVDTIFKNIFITGTSMGYSLGAEAFIKNAMYYMQEIEDIIGDIQGKSTMVALSNDPSPWIAGDYTYVNDIINQIGGVNAFGKEKGWTNVTAESITQKNPEVIIILDSSKYKEDEYDSMLSILSSEWRSTDAYKNGKIYLMCEDLGSLGSRAGPRFIQLMEIMALAIVPEAFPDNVLPLSVGDDYRDYLKITGGIE
jgi:iron complex transport system substrate-binding protein